jgi:hypothetical protein
MDLTSGVHESAIEERKGESGERCNLAEKAYSEECMKGAWANWVG